MKFKILTKFKDLIPPSSDDESAGLEKSILNEGCRDPLVLWFDEEEGEHFLIDGHQRYEIIQRLGLKHYQTKVIKLPKGMEPEEWIVENQFSRRNLDTYQRANLFLKLKPVLAAKAEFRRATGYFGSKNEKPPTVLMNSSTPANTGLEPDSQDLSATTKEVGATRKLIAQKAGVSEDSVRKTEIINNSGDEEIIAKANAGEISLNKAYKAVTKIEQPAQLSMVDRRKPDTFRPTILGEEKDKTWYEKIRNYLSGKIASTKNRRDNEVLTREELLEAETTLFTLRSVQKKLIELKPK